MSEQEEPLVLVVEFDDGIEDEEFNDTRIYRAAFAHRDDERQVVEGYICEGDLTGNEVDVLKDYNWTLLIELDEGRTLWHNLQKEMVEYTSCVLGLEVIKYKHSLLYLID